MENLITQAEAFRAAHTAERPIALPNVWDVMSARVVEKAGFLFLATSSNAIAESIGAPDNDSMDSEVVFETIRRIAAASALPVTVDIEAGYGLDADEVVRRLVAAGAIGCNLEDTDHRGEGLVNSEAQAERIAAVRAAASSLGVPVVVNARVDSVVRKIGSPEEQVSEVIRRGRLYLDAGADCIYPIMLSDEAAIGEIVQRLAAPVNINLRAGGPSFERLTELGVARISYASGLFRYAERMLSAAATQLRDEPGAVL